MLGWSGGAGGHASASPHPGLAWYRRRWAACCSALVAIFAGCCVAGGYANCGWPSAPQHLGFIGLAAMGTLRADADRPRQPDPLAALRLRRQLPWALAAWWLSALAGLAVAGAAGGAGAGWRGDPHLAGWVKTLAAGGSSATVPRWRCLAPGWACWRRLRRGLSTAWRNAGSAGGDGFLCALPAAAGDRGVVAAAAGLAFSRAGDATAGTDAA